MELTNENIYYADQVLAHFINPPPQNSKLYFEVHTTMPQPSMRNVGLDEDQTDNWQEPDEDLQTSAEESDYETDSLEDESDDEDNYINRELVINTLSLID